MRRCSSFLLLFPLLFAFGSREFAQTISRRQQILNVLAAPAGPGSPAFGLPSSFAGWTAEQQRTVPRQVAGRCNMVWTMANDAGPVHLLPVQEGAEQNLRLAMDACLLAKMPADWAARRATMAELKQILARDQAEGGRLSLPASVMK